MAITILVPTALRGFTGRKSDILVDAATVGVAVAKLAEAYPDIKPHLYNEDGTLRSYVNIYIGDSNIKNLGGLELALKDGDTLMLVPAIAGGRSFF